jgi:hypothetical protein
MKESTLREWKAVSYCLHPIPVQTLPNWSYIKVGLFTAELHDAEIFFNSSAHVHGSSVLKYPLLQIPADVNPYL